MMSKYVFSELGKVKPLCFYNNLEVNLSLHDRNISTLVKIDTGCAKTCISYKKIIRKDEDIFECKSAAISSKLKTSLSYGVNDSEEYIRIQKKLFNERRYQECTAISFYHDLNGIVLGDYEIPIKRIKVNYDRPSSMLIGMDILSQLDFHCGYSKVLNNYIFIGVLRTQEDKSDYYRALEEHFGILSNINEDFFNDEAVKNEASGFFAWLKNKHKN